MQLCYYSLNIIVFSIAKGERYLGDVYAIVLAAISLNNYNYDVIVS